jgi:hypothetical protein
MSYRIKPLLWEKYTGEEAWAPNTIFGQIIVGCDGDGQWRFRYCVDEYYDEGHGEYRDTKAEAVKDAEDWYLSRLMPALTVA